MMSLLQNTQWQMEVLSKPTSLAVKKFGFWRICMENIPMFFGNFGKKVMLPPPLRGLVSKISQTEGISKEAPTYYLAKYFQKRNKWARASLVPPPSWIRQCLLNFCCIEVTSTNEEEKELCSCQHVILLSAKMSHVIQISARLAYLGAKPFKVSQISHVNVKLSFNKPSCFFDVPCKF